MDVTTMPAAVALVLPTSSARKTALTPTPAAIAQATPQRQSADALTGSIKIELALGIEASRQKLTGEGT